MHRSERAGNSKSTLAVGLEPRAAHYCGVGVGRSGDLAILSSMEMQETIVASNFLDQCCLWEYVVLKKRISSKRREFSPKTIPGYEVAGQ